MISRVNSQSPILVLDSGLGGLTVVRELQRVLPAEEFLYFGDTARLPYGTKTAATVTTFVRQIIDYSLPHQPKHVVIACNTASALALNDVRAHFPGLSISGVIEPGSRAAIEAAGAKDFPTIGIIATEATVRSQAYEKAIHQRRLHARVVLLPTPLLVPMIEEGRGIDDPLVALALRQYLKPLIARGMDVLVLGCTHYPIFRHAIEAVVGDGVKVIDSAERCAEDVAKRLRQAGLLREFDQRKPSGLRCFVTDDSPRFAALASRFLGYEIDPPTWVPADTLYTMDHTPWGVSSREEA